MKARGQIEITLRGEQLVLLPERAVWWPTQKTLLLADLHLGKAGHFRAHGIAVPGKVNLNTLLQFERLIQTWSPKQVIFLGDLFHSTYNKEWDAFVEVLKKYDSQFILVRGNHDILANDKYEAAGIAVFNDKYLLGPFILSHEPLEKIPPGTYVLAGHVHPGVRLVGLGRQKLSLPCFYFGQNEAVLPAFGHFTGLYIMEADEAKAIYGIVDGTVLQVHGEKLNS